MRIVVILWRNPRGGILRSAVQVREDGAVTRHNFSWGYAQWRRKHRPRKCKGVKFPIFTTGVHAGRKFLEELRVEFPARESRVKLPRIDTGEIGAHTVRDHFARQPLRFISPDRKQGSHADGLQLFFAIFAEIGKKQIAESN